MPIRHRIPAIAYFLAALAGSQCTVPCLAQSGLSADSFSQAAGDIEQDQQPDAVTERVEPELIWWQPHVASQFRDNATAVYISLYDVLYYALERSEQIRVYSETPIIREMAIQEAIAAFDWTRFAETHWNDLSEPVGNTLTIGGPGDRFLDQKWTAAAGLRRRTLSGGEFEIGQRVGWQDNNSLFFVPDQQATTQFSLGFTQPLLKGAGVPYNRSLIVLAQLDTAVARDEYVRQLQSHLLEVVRAYWGLHLERARFVQKVRLFEITRALHDEIAAREIVDAQRSQLISAAAALEARRADLIRAHAAVRNAETRLRALCNHESLGRSEEVELIPTEELRFDPYETTLESELAIALANRPEISAALKETRAACIRMNVAENEILPQLNLVTRAYVSGLDGDSDFGQSFVNQFGDGRPSYTVGLTYEVPIGNRAARARLTRRRVELRQLEAQYRTSIELVKSEVEIAVRELETSYSEMDAKVRALNAAHANADALRARWMQAPGANGTGTLTLESLLEAQQRITDSEASLVESQLTWCLALSDLQRTNGTLLQAHDIHSIRFCENGAPRNMSVSGGKR